MESLWQNPATLIELILVAVGGIAFFIPKDVVKLFGVIAFLSAEFAIFTGVISRVIEKTATVAADVPILLVVIVTTGAGLYVWIHRPRAEVDDDGYPVSPDYSGSEQ